MKFLINRASSYSFSDKPCNEAFKVGEDFWGIEINSIDDLIALKDKYGGRVIVEDNDSLYFCPEYKHSITIYDDYVE